MHVSSLIDMGRYPLDRPGSPVYNRMLSDIHAQLRKDGCAILKGFAHPEGVKILAAEGDSVADKAHRSFSRTNAYFTQDDTSLPLSHPMRQFYDRSNGFIPADNFGNASPLRSIYEWEYFMPFVRVALEEPEEKFFRYDDPLADVIINMVEEGSGFPWHYDTNNYTVTLAIQNAEHGGEFEYAPLLRSQTDENFSEVQKVLSGDRSRVTQLVLEPGDLQIFKGRYSLHKVNPVAGNQRRYVGIFSFVEKEGMCGSVERTKQLYGRVLPRHRQREGLRNDVLID
ncbi:MAG: hypothetical protein P8L32_06760 [Paracoccaceae bacterium]|jgi:hypothetical protein|nr:hypothetical protein [Paracoccaceae bacterium]